MDVSGLWTADLYIAFRDGRGSHPRVREREVLPVSDRRATSAWENVVPIRGPHEVRQLPSADAVPSWVATQREVRRRLRIRRARQALREYGPCVVAWAAVAGVLALYGAFLAGASASSLRAFGLPVALLLGSAWLIGWGVAHEMGRR